MRALKYRLPPAARCRGIRIRYQVSGNRLQVLGSTLPHERYEASGRTEWGTRCVGGLRVASSTLLMPETLSMAFQRQSYQAVEELFVGKTAGGPELRVDARRGEAGDGVDLVEEQPVRTAFEEEAAHRHARRAAR